MRTPLILVIDEHPGTRRGVVSLLECGGFVALGVEDAAVAAEVMGRLRPSLVLMDCATPTPGGLATLARVRELPGGRDVPLVVYCGADNRALREAAATLGAAEFIHKDGESWPRLLDRVGHHLCGARGPGEGGCAGDPSDYWTP